MTPWNTSGEHDGPADSAAVFSGDAEGSHVLADSWQDDGYPLVGFGAIISYGTMRPRPGGAGNLDRVWIVAANVSSKGAPRGDCNAHVSRGRDRDEENRGLLSMSGVDDKVLSAAGASKVWSRTPPNPSSSERTDSSTEDDEESTCSEDYVPQSTTTPPLLFCLFGFFVNKLVSEVRGSHLAVIAFRMALHRSQVRRREPFRVDPPTNPQYLVRV